MDTVPTSQTFNEIGMFGNQYTGTRSFLATLTRQEFVPKTADTRSVMLSTEVACPIALPECSIRMLFDFGMKALGHEGAGVGILVSWSFCNRGSRSSAIKAANHLDSGQREGGVFSRYR